MNKCGILCLLICLGFLSCQKENDVPGNDDSSSVTGLSLKYSEAESNAFLNPADYQEIFDFLSRPGLPEKHPGFFTKKTYVQGIKVTKSANNESPVYVAVIGEAASYNNALGYYYYEGEGGLNEKQKGEVLSSIYKTGTGGITLSNPIVASEMEGGKYQIYRLYGDLPNGNFSSGLVIRFYLLPNGYGSPKTIKLNKFGLPYIITTDTEFNEKGVVIANGKRAGYASHIAGKTSKGDLVFSFEDLNSGYSSVSDNDFNDLVFIVTDSYTIDKDGIATLLPLGKSSRLSVADTKWDDLLELR